MGGADRTQRPRGHAIPRAGDQKFHDNDSTYHVFLVLLVVWTR
jgi:hypothetical protein